VASLGTVIVSWEVADVIVEFSVTLVGLSLVVSLERREEAERLIVPENTLAALMKMVELPDPPIVTLMNMGLAVIVKAGPVTCTPTYANRVTVPPLPVTNTE